MTIDELFMILGIEESPPDTWAFTDHLIETSTLDDGTKQAMHELNNPDTEPELMEIIYRLLYDSRPDNIMFGMPYSQKDIKRKLDKL